jgi:hypothetical protein
MGSIECLFIGGSLHGTYRTVHRNAATDCGLPNQFIKEDARPVTEAEWDGGVLGSFSIVRETYWLRRYRIGANTSWSWCYVTGEYTDEQLLDAIRIAYGQ